MISNRERQTLLLSVVSVTTKALAELESLDNRLANLREKDAGRAKKREKQRIKDIEDALAAEVVVIRQRRDAIIEQAELERTLAIANAETV